MVSADERTRLRAASDEYSGHSRIPWPFRKGKLKGGSSAHDFPCCNVVWLTLILAGFATLAWVDAFKQYQTEWSKGRCTIQAVEEFAKSECYGWKDGKHPWESEVGRRRALLELEPQLAQPRDGSAVVNFTRAAKYRGSSGRSCDREYYYKAIATVDLAAGGGQVFKGVRACRSYDCPGAAPPQARTHARMHSRPGRRR
jgi:hypothetical protein